MVNQPKQVEQETAYTAVVVNVSPSLPISFFSCFYDQFCNVYRCYVFAEECEQLFDPPFGSVSQTGRQLGDIATYICNPGYELVGDTTRRCEQVDVDTAAFSGTEPECRRMPSPPLSKYTSVYFTSDIKITAQPLHTASLIY